MGRKPSGNAWDKGTRGRTRTAASDRSYPPAYLDESAENDEFDPYGGNEASDDDSVVIPAITLPTARVIYPPSSFESQRIPAVYNDDDIPGVGPLASMPGRRGERTPSRRRMLSESSALIPHTPQLPQVAQIPPATNPQNVTLVPGNKNATRARRGLPGPVHVALSTVVGQRMLIAILVLLVVATGIFANTTGALQTASQWTSGEWQSLAGIAAAGPHPAPDILSASHYTAKYGFDKPRNTLALSSDERARLVDMLPYAVAAATAYNARYHQSMEPQMLLWWTHSEGIRGRINYSNCANNPPRAGYSYFSNIQNCPHSSFWQLGYGNQFSVIYILKNAFTDMHGDPNDPKLVQQVGQWVLNYDKSKGTVPKCGGYSCTFPAMTIDQIMSGINTRTGVETADNWWASVLSRDPGINCYMIAHALTFFNHAATKRWVGNYYYEPYWQGESDRLGDILAAWPSLRRDAHL